MKNPIVLAHGIARFDALLNPIVRLIESQFDSPALGRLFDRVHYFRNIKSHLEANGFKVFHSNVPFAASLEDRASALAAQLYDFAKVSGSKLHVIGHSMGGLDARYAIAKLGAGALVSTLSTIGTPHNGTSFADWAHAEDIRSNPLFRGIRGLADLTTDVWAHYNRDWMDSEMRNAVNYRVYGASEERRLVFAPLRRPWHIIEAREGANDGLVSLSSQLWARGLPDSCSFNFKTVTATEIPFPLDHLNECGWWDTAEPKKRASFESRVKDLYLQIASES